MKKCWRIQNNTFADIKDSLYKLKVEEEYINIILEDDSDPMRYLNQNPKPRYFYISYNGDNKHWGWFEEEYFNSKWLKTYEFCGEINMRKEKLKKINGEYK